MCGGTSPDRTGVFTLDCKIKFWCPNCFGDEEKKAHRRICIACGEDPTSEGYGRFNQFQGVILDPESEEPTPGQIFPSSTRWMDEEENYLASICDFCCDQYGIGMLHEENPVLLDNGLCFTYESFYRMND
jgi:hypothetical protein